ncbi:hypothetical protein LTR49_027950 [Elasticomyces elasticus]|nr:hypothetical protein LTR49_027950 [Elasticomyces elasticus]
MRVLDICRRRQRNTSLVDKAKWAIHGREHFLGLVDNVDKLVNSLLELFPAAQQAQRKLCGQEVETMRDHALWPKFLDAAGSQDKMLADAAASFAKKSASNTKNSWHNYGNTKVLNQGNQTFTGNQTFSF